MGFFNLKKGEVYQWLRPATAAGLKFRVVDIYLRNDTKPGDLHIKETRVYKIEYLNYLYNPRPLFVEITQSFVFKNSAALTICKASCKAETRNASALK